MFGCLWLAIAAGYFDVCEAFALMSVCVDFRVCILVSYLVLWIVVCTLIGCLSFVACYDLCCLLVAFVMLRGLPSFN